MPITSNRQGHYFEMCLGLKSFKNPAIPLEASHKYSKIKDFFINTGHSIEKDINDHICIKNKDRDQIISSLKSTKEKEKLINHFEQNLKNAMPSVELQGFENKKPIFFFKEAQSYLSSIKNIDLSKKNDQKKNLQYLKQRTIKFFKSISSEISEEKKTLFDEDLTILIKLSDRIINNFTSNQENIIHKYLEISEKIWNTISNDKPTLNGFEKIGTQIIFIAGSFLTFDLRSNREKLCIYIKRIAVPIIFTLHEILGYLLTNIALKPFILATGISVSGGTAIIGLAAFILGFVVVHRMAHLIDDYAQYEQKLAMQKRTKDLKSSLTIFGLKNVAEKISSFSSSLEKIQVQIKNSYSKNSPHIRSLEIIAQNEKKSLNLSSGLEFIRNLKMINLNSGENRKIEIIKLIEHIKKLLEIEHKGISTDIDRIFLLAHLYENYPSEAIMVEDEFNYLTERIADYLFKSLDLNEYISNYPTEQKNGIKEFLNLNIKFMFMEVSHNELPKKYKLLKLFLKFSAFEASDYALDNITVLGTVQLESAIKINDFSKILIINSLNICMQMGLLAPLYLLFKLPQVYLKNKFDQWEKETIHIANKHIEKYIMSNLNNRSKLLNSEINRIKINRNHEIEFKDNLIHIKNKEAIKIENYKLVQFSKISMEIIKKFLQHNNGQYRYINNQSVENIRECCILLSEIVFKKNNLNKIKCQKIILKIKDNKILARKLQNLLKKIYFDKNKTLADLKYANKISIYLYNHLYFNLRLPEPGYPVKLSSFYLAT